MSSANFRPKRTAAASRGFLAMARQSFESVCLPEDWKSANVVPRIFKKGRRGDVSNYRPVSLTSVPCKVIESLLKDDLTKHLESTSMLSKVQHGFLRADRVLPICWRRLRLGLWRSTRGMA